MHESRKQQAKVWWSRLRPWAVAAMFAAIAVAFAQYVADNWQAISVHRSQFNWIWVLAAISVALAFLLCVASCWLLALRLAGVPVRWTDGVWGWSRSFLSRYLPTPIWLTGSRIHAGVRLGAPWRVSLYAFGAEIVGALAAASTVSLLALPLPREIFRPIVAIAVAGVVIVLLPGAYTLALRLMKELSSRPSFLSLAGWSCIYAVGFLCYGYTHVLILQALSVDVFDPLRIVGASAFAWWVGTLNVLSPSGLGTRELVLIYSLGGVIAAPDLLMLSVASRLVVTTAEVVLFLASLGFATTFRRGSLDGM